MEEKKAERSVNTPTDPLPHSHNAEELHVKQNHIRIATVTAMAALTFGLAAPMASAVEAHRNQPAASTAADSLLPTADDVRDLISRMRANGADHSLIQEFELYAKQLESADTKGDQRILGSTTIIRKLIVAGIRHGGQWAGKIVGKLHKKSGEFLKHNGNKIADIIEDVEGWSETALTVALVKGGVPTDIAKDIAHAIMLIA
ncbi:hypothetical protein [Streptomyces zagrosensis]|uniref:Uncharacterized protein n=1 Tax=Streptomyces zagrosensis TaxID=1042984 RepID=A0A7W9QCC8_9ACTN|nr:hypothetical protein [Streptomyces zagrosensis]MBB5937643.1 hypothetical protein [Streptomyces zagrosensis]